VRTAAPANFLTFFDYIPAVRRTTSSSPVAFVDLLVYPKRGKSRHNPCTEVAMPDRADSYGPNHSIDSDPANGRLGSRRASARRVTP